jgi:hypothetical protein
LAKQTQRTTQAKKRRTSRSWTRLEDTALLDRPLQSLDLKIAGSKLERRVQRLYDELAAAGLRFRPYAWLSTDWFTPAGVTGFAIPFYLAHPRLERLEGRIMHEVEGGDLDSCMKLLRHETAHAIDHAYRLHWRKRWREVFGRASEPYRSSYAPHISSRDHVHNLDYFYSQSHPLEDFCETFSVWLEPRSRWKEHYAGWPALKKLEYVDELMDDLHARLPLLRSRKKIDDLRSIRMTLREYYDDKQNRYGSEYPDFYDEDLRRLFPDTPDPARAPAAAAYLRRLTPEMRDIVGRWTGEYKYTVDLVLKDMIKRCRELDLRVAQSEAEVRVELAAMLTMHTMNFVYGTDHEVPI